MPCRVRFHLLRSIAGALALAMAVPGLANDPLRFTACSHPLPPHTQPNPDGSAGGQASEILLAVASRLGWALDIRYTSWLRTRSDAERGQCDLIYTLLKKPEYETFAVFPREALSERRNVLVTRRDRGLHYDGDLEAFMRTRTLGSYHDKVVSPLFDRLKQEPWARIDYAPTPEQNLDKLLAGRFDAIVENSATAVHLARLRGRAAEIEVLTPPLSVTPAYVGFSRRGRALAALPDFDRELARFKATPAYAALIRRYETPSRAK